MTEEEKEQKRRQHHDRNEAKAHQWNIPDGKGPRLLFPRVAIVWPGINWRNRWKKAENGHPTEQTHDQPCASDNHPSAHAYFAEILFYANI
jgi:hypothetical protein